MAKHYLTAYKSKQTQQTKISKACDQEIPQSQTVDNPMSPRGRATQQFRDTRKVDKANQPDIYSPS